MMTRRMYHLLLWPVTLSALVLLACGLFLSTGPGRQWRVVREIRAVGGSVDVLLMPRPGWVGRIRAALPEAFGSVVRVRLVNVRIRPAWLVEFRNWKDLRGLWLNRASVSDSDLHHLAGHERLAELYLNGNPVSEAGLKSLGKKTSLLHLELDWTRVRAFDCLAAQFPSLQTLRLRGTQFSDRHIVELKGLPHLGVLDLSRTQLTDAGLQVLPTVRQLRAIDLNGTATTYPATDRMQSRIPYCTVITASGAIISMQTRRGIQHKHRLFIPAKAFE